MKNFLKDYRIRVTKALDQFLPTEYQAPEKLNKAIRYMSLNDSSKRIRALLVYMVGDELSASPKILDIAAASVEMLHIFSLIHDDLPCIDNSDLRHHRASCHKEFDEATAVLTGDALLLYAIKTLNIIANDFNNPVMAMQLITLITDSMINMVIGEHLDIELIHSISDLSQLNNVYNKKTTALISASVQFGAIAAGAKDQRLLESLREFGNNIGLAFQIVDDIIDVESSTETLGKPQGQDSDLQKVTYPSLIGMDKSKKIVKDLYDQSIASLASTGHDFVKLRKLAEFIIVRNY